MVMSLKSSAAVMILISILSSAASANLIFNVSLDGAQEFPANASPGIGTAIANFNQTTGAMSINGSFSNLLGNINNAHLHGYSAAGVNSGVIFGLSFTAGTSGTFSGNGIIPQARIQDILNGLSYINIHSTQFPGGEIRGQLINPVPEPGTGLLVFLAAGLGAIGQYRRRFAA